MQNVDKLINEVLETREPEVKTSTHYKNDFVLEMRQHLQGKTGLRYLIAVLRLFPEAYRLGKKINKE